MSPQVKNIFSGRYKNGKEESCKKESNQEEISKEEKITTPLILKLFESHHSLMAFSFDCDSNPHYNVKTSFEFKRTISDELHLHL